MKNKKSSAGFLSFACLFSGTVLHGGYYASGNAVVGFCAVSVTLVLFAEIVGNIAEKGRLFSKTTLGKATSLIFCVIAIAFGGFWLREYLSSLGTFGDYYASGFVTVFTAISVVFFGVYCGFKGKKAITGFARMMSGLLVVCTLVGVLGFLHTKKIIPPDSPQRRLAETDFLSVAWICTAVCFDVIPIFAVLRRNGTACERTELVKSVKRGVFVFLIADGINMMKNILLFGEEFASSLNNPDLAATRLIPSFEMPEISVISGTAAVMVKISVYSAMIFCVYRTLKNKNGDRE